MNILNQLKQKLANRKINSAFNNPIDINQDRPFLGIGQDSLNAAIAKNRAIDLKNLQSSRYSGNSKSFTYHNGILTNEDGSIDQTDPNNDLVHSGSTAVESIVYSPKLEAAKVKYRNNSKEYLYPVMNKNEFETIANASSKGRAMNTFNHSSSNVCHGQGGAAAKAYLLNKIGG